MACCLSEQYRNKATLGERGTTFLYGYNSNESMQFRCFQILIKNGSSNTAIMRNADISFLFHDGCWITVSR
jgi:hypothetical protein